MSHFDRSCVYFSRTNTFLIKFEVERFFKMTDEKQEILELIEVYRSLPALWDIKCAEYADRSVKEMQYKILLNCFKKHNPAGDLSELKKKINLLRTNYRRELRRRSILEEKREAGANVSFETTLYYFDAISFLEEVVTERANIISLKKEEEPLRKRRKRKTYEESLLVATDPLEEPEDANHHLAKVWAEKLSLMEPTQKIFAEKVINDVFLNGQLGLLTFNTTLTQTPREEPLNKYQFVQAFNYFLQNDDEFVQNLHEAYLNVAHSNNPIKRYCK